MAGAEHGLIITNDETITLMWSMGVRQLNGLPIEKTELDEAEQMAAVRSLLHKDIIRSENDEFFVNEPMKSAVRGLEESRYTLSIFSSSYRGTAYMCYTMNGGISVWEIDSAAEDRMVVYFTDADEFISKLFADGFIPEITEYCDVIPEHFSDEIADAFEQFRETGESAIPKIRLLIKQHDRSGERDDEFFIVSCGKNGSILSKLSGGKAVSVPYTAGALTKLLDKLCGDEEATL